MQLGIVVLNGTTKKTHMKQDLDILEIDDLSKEEMLSISKYIGDDLAYL